MHVTREIGSEGARGRHGDGQGMHAPAAPTVLFDVVHDRVETFVWRYRIEPEETPHGTTTTLGAMSCNAPRSDPGHVEGRPAEDLAEW